MQNLGIIPKDFPSIHAQHTAVQCSVGKFGMAQCGFPARSKPPGLPNALPFEPIEQNDKEMERWILDRYAASTFNRCPHQTLPMMKGEPARIHIRPGATPVAAHKPAAVPLHFKEEVRRLNEEDVALGVIEPVPIGVPSNWQSRMVVTPKADGTPRRTVDLSHLNRPKQ